MCKRDGGGWGTREVCGWQPLYIQLEPNKAKSKHVTTTMPGVIVGDCNGIQGVLCAPLYGKDAPASGDAGGILFLRRR